MRRLVKHDSGMSVVNVKKEFALELLFESSLLIRRHCFAYVFVKFEALCFAKDSGVGRTIQNFSSQQNGHVFATNAADQGEGQIIFIVDFSSL